MNGRRLASLGLLLVLTLVMALSPLQVAAIRTPPAAEEAASSLPAGVSADWWSAVQSRIRQTEYDVTWQTRTYVAGIASAHQAPNRAQNLRTYFTPQGIRVIPRVLLSPGGESWEWGLALREPRPGMPLAVNVSANQISYLRGAINEWYVNREQGLEMGLTFAAPRGAPPAAPLQVDLALSGSLLPYLTDDGHAVEFTVPSGNPVLRYGNIRATDAAGRDVPVDLEILADQVLRLSLAPAPYPVTIRADLTALHSARSAPQGLPQTPNWTAESDQNLAEFAISVDTAGDVNGDGFSDVIVGAHLYDNGSSEEGRAYLFYGSATGLSTTPNWSFEGEQANARLGYSVGPAGDVNGDGHADVIIGAPYFTNVQTREGRAFVFHGSPTGLGATPNWTAESNQNYASFGSAVGTAGDVNGDGFSDVIVGAPFYDSGESDEGWAFVFHGSATGLGATPWTAESNQANANFGHSVGTAGDVNADGFAEVIVGAPLFDNSPADEGAAFVYYGSGSGLGPSPNWTAESNQASARFGVSVGMAGDVNGDGYTDVIVGADWYDNGETDEGRAFVYHGSAAGLGATPWTAESNQGFANLGYAVGPAGDVNGDGYADVIVGIPFYDNGQADEGAASIYYGSAAGLGATAGWTVESDQGSAKLGHSVGPAGDVNGDGFTDVILGAPLYDNGQTDEGRAFVFHGSGEGPGTTPVWTSEGNQINGWLGYTVNTAGDVNGDGYADAIVGVPGFDGGQWGEGRALVYYGSPSGFKATADWSATGDQAGAQFGFAVATAGDVNGDGYTDVIVGAPFYDNPEVDEGRAYVLHGSAAGLGVMPMWTAEGNRPEANLGYAVGTAGDVNGDGLSDVIVGAPGDYGQALVYHGTGTGLSTSAGWTATGDQDGARLGHSVGTAGDVNADGFSDVIVGVPYYDNAQSDEGRACVYHGSGTGLSSTPNWNVESNQSYAGFGYTASTAGDVDGDGFSDVIVGAPRYDAGEKDEGQASVFYGSAAGLNTTPVWTAQGDQVNAYFGVSAGTAGDMNGDGFADVIVGARGYDNGETDEGRAFFYHGSAIGLDTTPNWTAECNQAYAWFGFAASTAGDINGDGFADVIVGAYRYDNGQYDEGVAFVYYGDLAAGAQVLPRQMRTDGSAPIAPLGLSDSETAVQLRLIGRTPWGRGQVKLAWQVAPVGVLFGEPGVIGGSSPSWTDSGTAGVLLSANVAGLTPATPYHWRLRAVYQPGNRIGQAASRWVHVPWKAWSEQDFRTRGVVTYQFIHLPLTPRQY